jgi:hypothetical protein
MESEKDKDIKLRFRFDKVISKSVETILTNCENLKNEIEPDYKIKISDQHVWFTIGLLRREKYSPNLHIELEKMEDGNTFIKGTYGPDPVLWTLFMFLHFIVAGVFLIFMIIVYLKWTLHQSFKIDLMIMLSMTIIWLILYFLARLNRSRGIFQMEELEKLYQKVIEN